MDKKIIYFICQLHGIAIRVKEIHWNTRSNDEHLLCDEIIDAINSLEDRFTESAMGYAGEKFPLGALEPVIPSTTNLTSVISYFERITEDFRETVSDKPGLLNVIDEMLEIANKYKYRATQVG